MAGFLIDPSKGETPASVAKKRAILQSMLMPYGKADNIGEGFAQLLNGVASGMQNRKLNKIEQSGQESGNATRQSVLSMLAGSMSPSAQSAPAQQNAAPDAMPPVSTAPVGKVDRSPIAAKIAETANALGISPVDLGTAISYETAGTFDPQKKGPTTQWGQHKGLIQFGEPQAKKFGVDWNNPVDSQLGPDGAVANYLRSTGVKPGMGLMEIYSAINAGGVGRNNRSDANNGGAPGTVADKVNKQMSGHRRNAEKLLAAFQGQPTQVASLDPSAGLASMIPEPSPRPMNGGLEAIAASMGQPSPQSIAPPTQAAPAPVQMAQAAPQEAPPQAPAVPPMPTGPTSFERVLGLPTQGNTQPQQGMNMQMLMEAANNPWLDDNTRQMVNSLIEREMQKQDPSYQMQQQAAQVGLDKSKLELQKMQNPSTLDDEYKRAQINKLNRGEVDGASSEAGLNLTYWKDRQGKLHAGQLLKGGGVKEIPRPEGEEWAPGVGYLDTGTGFTPYDKRAGIDPSTLPVPKDISGEAAARERGKIQGTSQGQLPSAEITAQQTISKIDELLADPNLANVSGIESYLPDWALAGAKGGKTLGVRRRVEQLKGSAFLEAYNGLRGGGQITEVEGQKAENAMARLETAQTDEDYVQALKDFRDAVQTGYAKLAANAGTPVAPPQIAPTGEKKRLKFNPATGELE